MPPTATAPRRDGCDGSSGVGLSRRGLLRLGGASLGAGLVSGTTLSGARVAVAAETAGSAALGLAPDVLVVVSLRGGMDGLSMLVPHGDPYLQQWRPGIAVPTTRLLPLDPMFGLHPAMAPLVPLWTSGRLAAVHACGMLAPNRSHFEAMAQVEDAAPGSNLRTGWIDRMVGLGDTASPFTATALSGRSRSLAGPAPELVVGSLAQVGITMDGRVADSAWAQALTVLHDGARPEVAEPLRTGFAASAVAATLPPKGGGYDGSDFAQSLSDVARLVKGDVGLRVATVDLGGWDMHAGLGSASAGRWMYDQAAVLARGLAAFADDLGPALGRVTVVTLSEFGRKVRQNDSGGVDHGYGNAVLVLGGGVRGGQVYGRWPGLAPADLVGGDLAVTTDYRDVLAEVLDVRCGISGVGEVFPGLARSPLGLARPRV